VAAIRKMTGLGDTVSVCGDGGWQQGKTVTVNAFVAVVFALSVTCIVNEKDPEAVGTPLRRPCVDRLMPGGRLPAVTAQPL
jgi:hypothetical protein